jgi:hypothetical protein
MDGRSIRETRLGPDPTDLHAGDRVDSWLPGWAEPYARLALWDRANGSWLLLFPGWWGIAFAGPRWPDPILLLLFSIGAVAMRGAGCTPYARALAQALQAATGGESPPPGSSTGIATWRGQ